MGLTLHTEGELSLWVRESETWDRRVISEVQAHYDFPDARLQEVRNALDVGAHIGAFTCWLKSINPDVRVTAAEVEPDNYRILRLNLDPLRGVRSVWVRVGYDDRAHILVRDPDNAGHTQVLLRDADIEGASPVYAPCRTLEDLATGMAWIDVLKIDVEGSEYDILGNAPDATLACIGCIVGEYHGGVARFRSELLPRLEKLFKLTYLDEAPNWGRFCLVNARGRLGC